ncbi:septum formation inhibitor nucleotide-binding protein Maf [Neoasaia chiangmaiensis NBRC 101099]|uniref:Nucleoside triphosphate pyrophosphatase n=1 Tax=Neoasaia chiangmaiensis TaxID=320497 RepID=A0A1U9KQD4_9PROT|nr:nucleoside triphosphate pyrophosphatase [Neoasaia chiangmaiensis]AQS88018.1 hypothetical protein A0U93_08760 [Neoasaia chiangmaiensis]GBR38839.1 septum formation inhibitor nucleotide-binding protein Maf [Neoasaia chiangmaiensis NBRC 101099]GEN15688.1 Maf-like protein [Neoasaia chiangmaiensis]
MPADTSQDDPILVLASGSAIRRQLLTESGLTVRPHPVPLDEAALRDQLTEGGATPGRMALELAHAKARLAAHAVNGDHGADPIILAADQILSCDGQIYGKPTDLPHARRQLLALRNRTHALHTAIVLFRGSTPLWSHLETPRMTMRAFSEHFLDNYLAAEGATLLDCVGAYRLEGRGAQLFTTIDGTYDAVLGLPRLPLFQALRAHGILAT